VKLLEAHPERELIEEAATGDGRERGASLVALPPTRGRRLGRGLASPAAARPVRRSARRSRSGHGPRRRLSLTRWPASRRSSTSTTPRRAEAHSGREGHGGRQACGPVQGPGVAQASSRVDTPAGERIGESRRNPHTAA
jgi:hypothetical protein